MSWQTFFSLKPSLAFVAGFGCLTFGLGFGYDKIAQELAKASKAEFWAVLLPPGVVLTVGTASLKFVQDMVSKEVEIEAKAQSEEIKQGAIKYCHDRYSEDVKSLKDEICSLSIPSENLERIQQSFSRLDVVDQRLDADFDLFRKIISWLEIQDNRLALLNRALNAVSGLNISDKHMMMFEQDMRECIHWLRYSIHELRACEVQPERQASALLEQMPQSAQAYTRALNAIKQHPEFQKLTTTVPFVNELIDYLQSEVVKMSRHQILAA